MSDLNTRQLQALDILLLPPGANDSQVASAVGVTRETVNRWKNKNVKFVSTLSSRRRELWERTKEIVALDTVSRKEARCRVCQLADGHKDVFIELHRLSMLGTSSRRLGRVIATRLLSMGIRPISERAILRHLRRHSHKKTTIRSIEQKILNDIRFWLEGALELDALSKDEALARIATVIDNYFEKKVEHDEADAIGSSVGSDRNDVQVFSTKEPRI